MTDREAVYPADRGRHALYDAHRYSPAIRSGDLLFVSGQVGSRPDGTPEPDFAAQVQLAFENLSSVLEAAGCGFDDIVDVTAFSTDPRNQSAAVRTVRSRMFGGPPHPNWTSVGVNWLSGFDFEIKVIARIPGAPGGDGPFGRDGVPGAGRDPTAAGPGLGATVPRAAFRRDRAWPA